MRPFSAVLWDLDGTLIDSEPVHRAALSAALARLEVAASPELHRALLGRTASEVYRWCAETYGLDVSYAELSALKHDAYAGLSSQISPRGRALDLFRRNEQRGVPQAIVSNSDRILVDVNLRAVGLLVPGLVTVSLNDVLEGKPSPEPFLRAAWLLRTAPHDCLVVEDSPVGAAAGLAAGMSVVCWPEGALGAPAAFPPDALVARSEAELTALVEEVQSRPAPQPHPE
jgi:beta-phosphoglucomutase-like phosphatase (HAD superfamily)